jgi:hypothetical protein
MKSNHFDKPKEQWQACLIIALARNGRIKFKIKGLKVAD